jgi:hypothetical protein
LNIEFWHGKIFNDRYDYIKTNIIFMEVIPMKRFQVAVVGCGGMAGAWINYAANRDDVEIKLLVDLNIAAAEEKKTSL